MDEIFPMKILLVSLTLFSCSLSCAAQSFLLQTEQYNVSSLGNPWLAGMPAGTVDTVDIVPDQAPTKVFQSLVPGTVYSWTATGLASNAPIGAGWPYWTPDGANYTWERGNQNAHGIQNPNGAPGYSGPFMALVGVFLGQNPQVFFMGSSGSVTIPDGVSDFYMGVADIYEWRNNSGSFDVTLTSVTPVPEPPAFIAAATVGLIAFSSLRKAKRWARIRFLTPSRETGGA